MNGHLLGTETLNQKEHQIIFKRIGEYATDVEFHHVHIPIQLGELTQAADKAMEIINLYATNIHKETLMHYRLDNRYPHESRAQIYADLLIHQNQFVQNNLA